MICNTYSPHCYRHQRLSHFSVMLRGCSRTPSVCHALHTTTKVCHHSMQQTVQSITKRVLSDRHRQTVGLLFRFLTNACVNMCLHYTMLIPCNIFCQHSIKNQIIRMRPSGNFAQTYSATDEVALPIHTKKYGTRFRWR